MTESLWFAVLGSPVAHSKSPAMHAAAYRALGLPHVYEAIQTSDAELPERIAALRDQKYSGFNVTVPHKVRVLALVDELDPTAEATGAANTLVRAPSGKIRGHNTDAPALEQELVRLAGGREHFRGRTALVLGTGGAARAALFSLKALGAGRIVVRGRSGPLVTEPLDAPSREARDLAAIVQTTSCGMEGASPGAIVANAVAWESVPKDAVALDVVYVPPVTPFLERAEAHGLRHDHGLGMLARQGALAFELWLGIPAPLDVMREALVGRARDPG